jgi:FixJ family two-component response regulator
MVAKPTVFIVDDDAAFLDSISALVSSLGMPVEAFASVEELLGAFDPARPGCLLLDIHFPSSDGTSIQEHFSQSGIDLPVIIISGTFDASKAVRAMRYGAVAFLQKANFAESELLEAIQTAIAKDDERRHRRRQKARIAECVASLTEPELQVLKSLLKGDSHANIATSLDISRRTVENRRAKIFRKLEVDTLPQLIQIAHLAGLLSNKSE